MCEECGGEYGHADWCPAARLSGAIAAATRGPEEEIARLKGEVERWQKRAILAEAKLEER